MAISVDCMDCDNTFSANTSRSARLDLPDPGIPDTPTSSRWAGSRLLSSRKRHQYKPLRRKKPCSNGNLRLCLDEKVLDQLVDLVLHRLSDPELRPCLALKVCLDRPKRMVASLMLVEGQPNDARSSQVTTSHDQSRSICALTEFDDKKMAVKRAAKYRKQHQAAQSQHPPERGCRLYYTQSGAQSFGNQHKQQSRLC